MAIEVDGPYHFSINQPYINLGTTLARNRLLAYHGFELVQVPFFEWNDCKSESDKREYLKAKLLGVLE